MYLGRNGFQIDFHIKSAITVRARRILTGMFIAVNVRKFALRRNLTFKWEFNLYQISYHFYRQKGHQWFTCRKKYRESFNNSAA